MGVVKASLPFNWLRGGLLRGVGAGICRCGGNTAKSLQAAGAQSGTAFRFKAGELLRAAPYNEHPAGIIITLACELIIAAVRRKTGKRLRRKAVFEECVQNIPPRQKARNRHTGGKSKKKCLHFNARCAMVCLCLGR